MQNPGQKAASNTKALVVTIFLTNYKHSVIFKSLCEYKHTIYAVIILTI